MLKYLKNKKGYVENLSLICYFSFIIFLIFMFFHYTDIFSDNKYVNSNEINSSQNNNYINKEQLYYVEIFE